MDQNISTLNLSKNKINKLSSVGIYSCNELNEKLISSLAIPRTLLEPPPTKTAFEILEEELLNGYILSFNSTLDQVLIDEIVPKRITEIAGFPGTGKTQICFQICVTTQLPRSLGGLEGEVVYISTNKNFASHRLRELASKFIKNGSSLLSDTTRNFTEESILKHVHVFTSQSLIELFAAISYMKIILKETKIKLLIIDSISNVLKDVEPAERTTLVYKLFNNIQELAVIHKFAIVVTNDFTTKIKDNESYYAPCFGESFFDRVNSRICLSKKNNIYQAELVKSAIKAPMKRSRRESINTPAKNWSSSTSLLIIDSIMYVFTLLEFVPLL